MRYTERNYANNQTQPNLNCIIKPKNCFSGSKTDPSKTDPTKKERNLFVEFHFPKNSEKKCFLMLMTQNLVPSGLYANIFNFHILSDSFSYKNR